MKWNTDILKHYDLKEYDLERRKDRDTASSFKSVVLHKVYQTITYLHIHRDLETVRNTIFVAGLYIILSIVHGFVVAMS